MDDRFTCFYDDYWNCELPVRGSDNSAILHMGIEFGPFSEGDKNRGARLPDGWKKEKSDENQKDWYDVLDDRGRVRIKIFQYKLEAFMYPERRFSTSMEESVNAVVFYVLDNNYKKGKEKIIFKQQFALPNKKRFLDAYNKRIGAHIEEEVCKKWLNKTLPKWDDYGAYWNDDEADHILND
jgi:hypothetical protein